MDAGFYYWFGFGCGFAAALSLVSVIGGILAAFYKGKDKR